MDVIEYWFKVEPIESGENEGLFTVHISYGYSQLPGIERNSFIMSWEQMQRLSRTLAN